MLKFLVTALPLILAIYALVDCAQTPSAEIRGLPKPAWLAVIVLPLVGPVSWLVLGRQQSTLRRLLWPSAAAGRSAPSTRRSLAPDDDPDFLRQLGHTPRPSGHGRRTTRDEDALLDEWERDLGRGGERPNRGTAPDDGPDDDGSEGSTDGAPRV
jgi:hypothetical protein